MLTLNTMRRSVEYDQNIIGLNCLLRLFFDVIDPTTLNRQGLDTGTQYRTGIYFTDPSDEDVIKKELSLLQNKLHSLAAELRIKTMMSPERAEIVLSEHRNVVESIFSGDPQKAKQAVITHLKNAAQRAGMDIYMP